MQMERKIPSNFGLTAFRSMIMEGRLSVVTAIIKARIVPSCAPFASRASATGIARVAGRLLEKEEGPSSLRGIRNLNAKNVLDAAKAGDALALKALDTSCYYLGWALAAVTMVLDPEAYLIGGGVSRAGTFLTDRIKTYHDQLSPMATKKADIVLAELGNDAGIYGAAKLILG